jgi:hypothetical protein
MQLKSTRMRLKLFKVVNEQGETIQRQAEQFELVQEYMSARPQQISPTQNGPVQSQEAFPLELASAVGPLADVPRDAEHQRSPSAPPGSPLTDLENDDDEVLAAATVSATSPASAPTPHLVLTPPTPQTSQEIAAHGPLPPVSAAQIPSLATREPSENLEEVHADDGRAEGEADIESKTATAEAGAGAKADMPGCPPQAHLLPPCPATPTRSSPSPRSRSRSRLSPIPPDQLRRSPRVHSSSPVPPLKRTLPVDGAVAGSSKRARKA